MPSFNEVTGARISSGGHVRGTDREKWDANYDVIFGRKGEANFDEWIAKYKDLCKIGMNNPSWELDEEGCRNIKKFYFDKGDTPEEAAKLELGAVGWLCAPKHFSK